MDIEQRKILVTNFLVFTMDFLGYAIALIILMGVVDIILTKSRVIKESFTEVFYRPLMLGCVAVSLLLAWLVPVRWLTL